MWIVKKVREGETFEVRHISGYVHAHFKLKGAALLESAHLNRGGHLRGGK